MTTTYTIYTSLVEFPYENGDFKERFDVNEKTYLMLKNANRGPYGIIPMTLCVIRADNLKNFLTDLFCPTLVHAALKVEQLAGRIILGIGCFFLDLITLPIRLLTLVPRVAYVIWQGQDKYSNPAYQFLQSNSKDKAMYQSANTIYYTAAIKTADKVEISSGKFYFTPKPKARDSFGDFLFI